MSPQYRSALIIGLGESGETAAGLLRVEGSRVTIVDRQNTAPLAAKAGALGQAGVHVLLGVDSLSEGFFKENGPFDVCIVSPGVPADSEMVRTIEQQGISVLSELELAASRCQCPMLAITGSNGKSTMSKLCAEALAQAGLRVALAGNFGSALSRVAPDSPNLDWAVVEVSSFQLEKVKSFRPKVGVLLNLHPNHLDRHRSMERYARLKMRMFEQMDKGDIAIVPEELTADVTPDPPLLNGPQVLTTFGLSNGADYRFGGNRVWLRPGRRLEPVPRGSQPVADEPGRSLQSVGFEGTLFANEVMGVSAAAAVAALEACGEDPTQVGRAARNFEPLPHRLQKIAEIRGITFIDDSKATNLSALRAALQTTPERVRLIAGGILKEHELSRMQEWLAKKVMGVYLIGRDGGKLREAWSDIVACHMCGSLENAVRMAWSESRPGDTVLLSPGCASFDQFANFEERGRQFAQIIATLS